ncbi:hypothetical protein [Microvirga sp. KLBC 81]|uniref:hypothetical protein n=1 Tax=Microvirga sp. KLBC 81 TaxID=1862707 RepID=UPI001403DC8E|nr:hypothetical protein [Microvirga sp. KLBC 81]
MGLPEADVRAAILKAAPGRPRLSSHPPPKRGSRQVGSVVVEHRASRVLIR